METILFHVSFGLFLFVIIRFKEYKKSLSVFFLLLSTIFYTPVLYYLYLDGNSYRKFSEATLNQFILLSSILFLTFFLLLIFKQTLSFKKRNKTFTYNKRSNILVKIYIFSIILFVLSYIIIYHDKLPLFMNSSGMNIEGYRPDVSGGIPFYFLFTTLQLIIPSFYFYYLKELKEKKIFHLLAFILVSLTLIVGGNKGILLFFYMFIWIYEYKFRINIKIFVMFVFAFGVYMYLKIGTLTFNKESMDYMLESPIRRFFVTQGSGFINRIELLNIGYIFVEPISIKEHVHQYIYSRTGGAAPTYFLGDYIVKYGIWIAMFLHFVITSTIVIFSRYIDMFHKKDLFVGWSFFIILYLIGMAEIEIPFLYRLIVLIANALIIMKVRQVRLDS